MFPFVESSLVKAICSKFSKLILLNEYLAAVHVIEMVTAPSFHSHVASSIPTVRQQGLLIANPFRKVMGDVNELLRGSFQPCVGLAAFSVSESKWQIMRGRERQ